MDKSTKFSNPPYFPSLKLLGRDSKTLLMGKYKSIKELARYLRKNPTQAESALWEVLRKRQLKSFKFLRQHPIIYSQKQEKINFFIADFYCAAKKLIVELDGKIHTYQKNLRVLRIKNTDLKNIALVKRKIMNSLN